MKPIRFDEDVLLCSHCHNRNLHHQRHTGPSRLTEDKTLTVTFWCEHCEYLTTVCMVEHEGEITVETFSTNRFIAREEKGLVVEGDDLKFDLSIGGEHVRIGEDGEDIETDNSC